MSVVGFVANLCELHNLMVAALSSGHPENGQGRRRLLFSKLGRIHESSLE